jgi:sugar lactone lactonase YvrE
MRLMGIAALILVTLSGCSGGSGGNGTSSTPMVGIISTVAGDGTPGYSGDGGPATSAELDYPLDVAVDGNGNMYISDMANLRVRMVTSAGMITTYAGDGNSGSLGATYGGAATSEALIQPEGLAVDSVGNLYITDPGIDCVFKVVPTGIMSIVAGKDISSGYNGDGELAINAWLEEPVAVAVDSSGNLYIADTNNNRIRKVTASTGVISTVAGNGTQSYSGDGGAATNAALNGPFSVAVDTSGNLYIADSGNYRVRRITASTGIISTAAGNGTPGYSGDGGAATSAELGLLGGITVDSRGNLYIVDGSRVRKVTY